MVEHPSALKRHRQSVRRQQHNRWWKARVRSATKAVVDAAGGKNKKVAADLLKKAVREVSKAKSKGILHANTASRKIARLTRLVASL